MKNSNFLAENIEYAVFSVFSEIANSKYNDKKISENLIFSITENIRKYWENIGKYGDFIVFSAKRKSDFSCNYKRNIPQKKKEGILKTGGGKSAD